MTVIWWLSLGFIIIISCCLPFSVYNIGVDFDKDWHNFDKEYHDYHKDYRDFGTGHYDFDLKLINKISSVGKQIISIWFPRIVGGQYFISNCIY